jgi:hypothetical protein
MSTTSDLAKWLRMVADSDAASSYTNRAEHMRAAAARLDELERENARMREALRPFADWADHHRDITYDHYVPECEIDGPGHSLTITLGDFRKARASLAGSGEK